MSEPPDAHLAESLATLGNPLRLAILRELRAPRPVGEIQVRHEARPLSRQSVREHLDRLLAAGLVEERPAFRDARSPSEYVVNHQGLFALSEEIRALARLRPTVEPRLATAGHEAERRRLGPAPCLVLAKGIDEGAVFPLDASRAGAEHVVGRKRGLAVSLDFDPYVSAENSRITWDGSAHLLEDLPGSRNGTTLNFEPLRKGASAALDHGDLVGVGRTLLVYRRR